jgi:acyl-CoA synthetase (AMP-forming)/AMP-acid ligase II
MQAIFNYITQTASIVHLLTEDGQMSDIQPATLICTPLFHVTAEIPVFLQSFALGRKLVLMPKWSAEEAMRLIQDEQVNYFVGVPLMSYEILVHPKRGDYDLSTCKSYAGGGAPRPPEHVKRLATEMGEGKPLLGYGLTETNAVGCGIINENYVEKPLSTGPASKPLVDLAILDDNGEELPQGGVGEVCIRSVANFEGYWNNPEATKAAFFDSGYFRSGDLGYVDADGYLFIVDRKKDIIIRGGENISCPEVEAAIYEHPDANECAVFGLPDERLGEVVGAVIWMKPGSAVDEAAIRDFLAERLAPYKVPLRIWMVDGALPKLGSEKIDKVTLRGRYRAEYEAEAAA